MQPTTANIIINRGTTFSTITKFIDENGDPVNLTGYVGTSQLRKHYSSNTAVSFDVSIQQSNGTIQLDMSANTTSMLDGGRYVYDCNLTTGNTIIKFLQGDVLVIDNVTR